MSPTTQSVATLTPHMAAYAGEFADSGNINWLPYVMYFQPYSYRSDVVNTDSSGFRYSEAEGRIYSVNELADLQAVRVLAGSSTVFGIGASADRHTLSSRMTENDPHPVPWLNFGGRSFNSTQELILFCLHRHKLPKVEEIVLLSGFNDLGLARLPSRFRMEHGAFFMCREFFDAMEGVRGSRFSSWFRGKKTPSDDEPPSVEEQLRYAASLTLRNLSNWKALADHMGAKLTFVLQPLSNWVRKKGAPEEEALFGELEARGSFAAQYGDILISENFHAYAENLENGARKLGIGFVNLAPLIRARADPDQWIFVDRIHFTDAGHDFVSKILLDAIANK